MARRRQNSGGFGIVGSVLGGLIGVYLGGQILQRIDTQRKIPSFADQLDEDFERVRQRLEIVDQRLEYIKQHEKRYRDIRDARKARDHSGQAPDTARSSAAPRVGLPSRPSL